MRHIRYGKKGFLIGLAVATGSLWVNWGCSNMTVLRTREIRAVGDSVKAVEQKVVEVQKSVDDLNLKQGGTSSKMRADLTLMLGELKDQISQLRSEIDETQYRLGQLSTKLEHLEQRKIVIGGDTSASVAGVGGAAAAAGANPKVGNPAAVKVVEGLDLDHIFNQAREDYVRGKYDLSYSEFKTVYEKDQGGSYKELALYWMGECLYKGGKPDKAFELYARTISEFPKGTKVCSARFKMGLMQNDLNEKEKRDEIWSQLLKTCPGTNEAGRAEEMMKE